jgi:hypothetical protein
MRPKHRQHLVRKGWKEKELQEAEKIIDRVAGHEVHFSKIVFWTALLLVILGNIMVSVVLMMFVIALNPWAALSMVAVMGAVMGFLYNFLINDIGHLEKKHHVWAGIIVPVLAIVNIISMVLMSRKFTGDLGIENTLEPLTVGIVFAVAFIIPTITGVISRSLQRRKAVITR